MFLLSPLRKRLHDTLDRWRLGRLAPMACDVTSLRPVPEGWLESVFSDQAVDAEWPAVEAELAALAITTTSGGVNPGDRRALYYLVRALRPSRVLEIGTHVGASTVHIAAALRTNGPTAGDLTTVDLLPVNDPVSRPWAAVGSRFAPAEMVAAMRMEDRVRFVTRPSLEFLHGSDERYSLIFLDGDHSAATVYRELPAALRLLEPNGLVLLHDYYVGGRPMWPNGVVIRGPWMATERLRAEGAGFRVQPLGHLPWPTKLGTNTTSLAICVGIESRT